MLALGGFLVVLRSFSAILRKNLGQGGFVFRSSARRAVAPPRLVSLLFLVRVVEIQFY